MMPSISIKSTDSHPSGLTRLTDWPRRGNDWSCYQNSWIGWPHANMTGLWLYYGPTSIFRHSSLTCLMELCFHADNLGKSLMSQKQGCWNWWGCVPGMCVWNLQFHLNFAFESEHVEMTRVTTHRRTSIFLSEFMELHSVRYWTWS